MKSSINFILFFMVTSTSFAQNNYPLAEDVNSISSLMSATYEVVSGRKGDKRNWQRDASLHHPSAVYAYKNSHGEQVIIPVSEFHKDSDEMMMTTDFFEYEINREVRLFGNIAHVWSTYETKLKENGPVERRGINSVQLLYDQDRWWIISWIFDRETETNRIPAVFDRH